MNVSMAIIFLAQIIFNSKPCPALDQSSFQQSDNQKALLDYIRKTKEIIEEERLQNIEVIKGQERLELEVKRQAERKKTDPVEIWKESERKRAADQRASDLLKKKLALLNDVENALHSLKSLTLIKEVAEILAILFTDIGEEGTNQDFALIEELVCWCSRLEELPVEPYSASNLNDFLAVIKYEYSKKAPNLDAFLRHYINNGLLCKTPIEYFDLSIMAGIGGVFNAFEQSCTSMFGRKFKVRGFNVGGGVGLGGGLFFGTIMLGDSYRLIKHYEDTKGMQFNENNTAFCYDLIILMKGVVNGPAWGMLGAGSWLVGGVAKELEIAWIKEKSRSNKKRSQLSIWISLKTFILSAPSQ